MESSGTGPHGNMSCHLKLSSVRHLYNHKILAVWIQVRLVLSSLKAKFCLLSLLQMFTYLVPIGVLICEEFITCISQVSMRSPQLSRE